MPEKKRQHFVPQFYLRNFGLGSSGRQISLYHLPSSTFVALAPIRSQAYEHNFYRSGVVEECLSVIEGGASQVITRIVKHEALPERSSEDHYVLAAFIVLQRFRTAYAAEASDEHTEQLYRSIANHASSGHADAKQHLLQMSQDLKDGPASPLKMAVAHLHLMFDLRYKLLRNQTSHPFITSDHPVVFYNQFLEHRNPSVNNTGIACKGLQIFFPLSPNHQLILFDSEIYKVGGRRLHGMIVDISLPEDVSALNVLQAANADEHLYFNGAVSIAVLQDIIRRSNVFRRHSKSRVRYYQGESTPDGRREDWIQTQEVEVRTGLRLRCVRPTLSAEQYECGNKVVHVRESEICKLHLQFMSEVHAGRYGVTEFARFLRDQGTDIMRN